MPSAVLAQTARTRALSTAASGREGGLWGSGFLARVQNYAVGVRASAPSIQV